MDRVILSYLFAILLFISIAVFSLSYEMKIIAYASAAVLLMYAYHLRYGDN